MMNPPQGAGALILIGGGGTPSVVHDEFFRLAGGSQARVVHVPSATTQFHEITDQRSYYCEFFDRAPASFGFLHAQTRFDAEAPGFADVLDNCTGVWMGGGNQNRLADLFLGTEVVPKIRSVLARGGVVAGTSSGTSIMSDKMICFGYTCAELGPGFGLFPGAICDPHFSQRQREHRLATGVLQARGKFGIGIDEKAALVVDGRQLRVIGEGSGSVWFYFAQQRSGKIKRYRLAIGETLELATSVFGASRRAFENRMWQLRPGENITLQELLANYTY